MFERIFELNKNIFLSLNNLSVFPLVKKTVYLFADGPIFLIPLFLVGFWIFYAIRKNKEGKKRLLLIFYSTILAISINLIIQRFLHTERPEVFIKSVGHLLLTHVPDASFPSDHASVGMAFAMALFLFGYTSFGSIVLPFIIIMLLSRIVGGVHWPLDILGGSVVGISSALIIRSIKEKSFIRKMNDFLLKIASYVRL